jgi:hypothetical protein
MFSEGEMSQAVFLGDFKLTRFLKKYSGGDMAY